MAVTQGSPVSTNNKKVVADPGVAAYIYLYSRTREAKAGGF